MKSFYKQRGTAIVEAAIVLPIVALMMFAAGEFGRAFYHLHTVTKSAQDAGRYLSTQIGMGDTGLCAPLDTIPDAITTTENLIVYANPQGDGDPVIPGLTTEQVQITPNGDHFTVEIVGYTYQPIWGNQLPFTDIVTDWVFGPAITMRVI